jgi:NAD(P)-dependent dehydrogenase (short-subunit alcohol dehydrogenase family)
MLEFQRSMTQMTNNFLQTQERVMIAYLGHAQTPPTDPGRGSGEAQFRQVPFYPANTQTQFAANADSVRAEGEAGKSLNETAEHQAIQAARQAVSNEAIEAARQAVSNESIQAASAQAITGAAQVAAVAAVAPSRNSNNNDASAGALNAEALIQQLIQIVSERTGYPGEMLDPTLDLEADLGIDSIKRVEILNNFRKLLPEDVQAQLETGIEKLAGTKTLQGIMDWIRSDLAPSGNATPAPNATAEYVPPEPAAANSEVTKAKNSNSYLARALVTLKALEPLTKTKPELSGLYLITDSEDGLAETLAAKLVSAGAETLILRHRNAENLPAIDLPASRVELDLCREEMVRAFAKKVSEKHDRIAGLIHLLPLNPKLQDMPAPNNKAANFAIPRSLLVLSRELLLPQLQAGQAVKLFAATNLGGGFGYGEEKNFNPIHASIPGMLKTFAREFPLSIVRAVDFSTALAQSNCAESIVAELGQDNKELIEVAYSEKGRFTLEATPTEIAPGTLGKIKLEQHSLVLVTGGARGITAELCVELGERHKPTFVIIGRGTKPAEAEDPEYKGLNTPREIKAVIMDKLRRAGAVLNVPAVESVYQKLLKDREIRNNLARIEATGSRVIYYALDVRDQVALTALIDRLYDSFGKIDAVIHGAGVIEDALIKDKTLASFDRVFGTKVESALTLASRLQLDKLKYLIFFSSVVGRTGNSGQCDYVAANEVLNKLALKLNSESSARVLSIGWGPWRGGMAQDDLEEVFARYGWSMIEVQEGRNAFYNELRFGGKENAEVLLVGQIQSGGSGAPPAHINNDETKSKNQNSAPATTPATTAAASSKSAPKNGDNSGHSAGGNNGNNGGNGHNGSHGANSAELIRGRGTRLQRAEILEQDANNLKIRLRIDPDFDVYLKDHAFDGMPVLPMAVASELLAETAQFMYPNMKLIRLERMDIPSGVMFDSGARDLYLTLAETSRSEEEIHADLNLCIAPNSTRKNFIARAILRSQSAPAPQPSSKFPLSYRKQEIADLETPPKVVDVYTNWLFHGPLFQGISSINEMGRNGIEGELRSTPIEECLKEVPAEPWIVDPLLLDSGMQLAGVWARNYMGLTALPTGFGALYIMAPIRGDKFRAIVQIPEESKNGQLRCDLAIYDEEGKLLIVMEDLGGVGSKALNRLGATPKALRSK